MTTKSPSQSAPSGSASAHTPGPWSVSPTSNPDREFGISAIDGTIVARIDYWYDEAEAESEANAKLIAAAPDLLAALREIQDLARSTQGNPHHESITEQIEAKARAALAQAKE